MAFGETKLAFELNLSRKACLKEAASNLFSMLHQLEGRKKNIAIMPIPEKGLGVAINDRLKRASAS